MKVDEVFSTVKPTVTNFRKFSLRMLPYWTAAALTALVSVLYAKVFGWSEHLAYSWFRQLPELVFVLTPLAMLASSSLAQYLAPTASGSGIPQLIAALEVSATQPTLSSRLLSVRMVFVKFFGSCVCVAGGGVTGREGPMLQIAGGIFFFVQRTWQKFFPKAPAPDLQSMILAGGAAGLASAFNTPLGGVIFAIEELAKVHISTIRTYVFHAVIMAGIFAQVFLGNYLYFGQINADSLPFKEIAPLIAAAAIIGIAGAVFGKAIVVFMDQRALWSQTKRILSTLFLGLIVATIAYLAGEQALGAGKEVIMDSFAHAETPAHFSLGFIRAFGNYFTYIGGVIGGVFAPALATGAAFGSSLSGIFPESHHQVWILAGMVAFLTGVTRTPFTSLILVLEMTDTHNVILYLMLSAIISSGAASIIDRTSFYEHMVHRILKANREAVSS